MSASSEHHQHTVWIIATSCLIRTCTNPPSCRTMVPPSYSSSARSGAFSADQGHVNDVTLATSYVQLYSALPHPLYADRVGRVEWGFGFL